MSLGQPLPVLMYHHISPKPGLVTCSPENFRAHMQWLAENGWKTLATDDFAQALASGEVPKKSVLVTFDDGYLDLARKLVREGVNDLDAKVQLDPKFASIVPRLANLIGGQYLLENGRFVFEPGRYEEKGSASRTRAKHAQMYQDSTEWKFVPSGKHRLSSGMTAEGFRKIGVLQRLLSNGSLNPGATGPLLWDEPESNLNPKLMRDLVQALLELARNGQQIILATHDYVLLKWFDLLMDKGKGDQVRFHVLSRDADSGQVRRDSMDDYRAIEPNAIADTFNELTKEQVARKMGALGK